jgi:hypothetical protein
VSKEPTSVPELNLAEALQRAIGLRLDRRFTGVHRRIYFALALLIFALAGTGIALWSELRDLKGDLARTRADADAVKAQVAHHKERLAQLEENFDKRGVPHTPEAADQKVQLGKLDEKLDKNLIETARASQGAMARIESKLPTTSPELTPTFASMTLSDEERDVIRKFFGVRKKEDATKFDAKVGAIAPDTAALYPIPSLLYSDVPKLKGYRQEQRSTKRGQSRFACVRR